MTAHQAVARRVSPPQRGGWWAWCPNGCTLPRAASKEQAEHIALVHSALMLAAQLRCECYAPDEMEYDPAGKCPPCQLNDMLRRAA